MLMITLVRNRQRRHVRSGNQEVWRSLSFEEQSASDDSVPLAGGFGFLVALDELRLPPGESTEPHSDAEAEVLTYVYKGALSQDDTNGNSGVIHAGEFQVMSTGRRIRHRETNASRSDWAHVFRVSLRPSQAGIDCERVHKRFTEAQRRNVFCVVASPDGRRGTLRIHQDASVYSAIVDPGHHLIHELATGRMAWLHVVCGEVICVDIVLTQGDGVGVTDQRSVSLTVQEDTEMLLVDLGPANLPPWQKALGS
jgi:hypothetical protein